MEKKIPRTLFEVLERIVGTYSDSLGRAVHTLNEEIKPRFCSWINPVVFPSCE